MSACSLLIPCYNAAGYLPRLWESIMAQTVPFDEVICFDDGSTDDTAEVAKKLGAQVLVGETNQGPGFARNQLMKAAQFPWVHFHDADDGINPLFLERMRKRISDQVDVVVCNADWVDQGSGEVLIPRRYTQEEYDRNALSYTINNPVGVTGTLYRREILLAISGFDETLRIWEDGDLHVRLAAAGASFSVIEEVLVTSIRHQHGISANPLECEQCRLRVLKRYAREYDESLLPVIALEAEKTATNLVTLGERAMVREVLEFCRSIGGDPPTTNNHLLKMLKRVLPAHWLFYFQQCLRR